MESRSHGIFTVTTPKFNVGPCTKEIAEHIWTQVISNLGEQNMDQTTEVFPIVPIYGIKHELAAFFISSAGS